MSYAISRRQTEECVITPAGGAPNPPRYGGAGAGFVNGIQLTGGNAGGLPSCPPSRHSPMHAWAEEAAGKQDRVWYLTASRRLRSCRENKANCFPVVLKATASFATLRCSALSPVSQTVPSDCQSVSFLSDHPLVFCIVSRVIHLIYKWFFLLCN